MSGVDLSAIRGGAAANLIPKRDRSVVAWPMVV